MIKSLFSSLFFVFGTFLYSQSSVDSLPKTQQLSEVVISSSRIEIPLKESSRTIQIISSEQLKSSGVITAVEALQFVSGIDIRQRGVTGMQADLYIRGGSFDVANQFPLPANQKRHEFVDLFLTRGGPPAMSRY